MGNTSKISVYICQVLSVKDETDGDRIKVRINHLDNKITHDDNLPYAYPLLPKMLHVKPKVGETVLVIPSEVGNVHSIRYYVGPLISQPQFMEEEPFGLSSLSLYPGSRKEPAQAPSTNPKTHGAYAKDEDIGIYGRTKNDIIMTEDDIRISSGVRVKGENGDVVFNADDPAFIHLKHSDEKRGDNGHEYRSTATVVADKINLISHQSNTQFTTNNIDEVITNEEMQRIIDKAHQLPYGDVLVDFLKLFVKAFSTHVHPYPGIQPCETADYLEVTSYDLNKILSDNVRIN